MRESNSRQPHYKCGALPTELTRRGLGDWQRTTLDATYGENPANTLNLGPESRHGRSGVVSARELLLTTAGVNGSGSEVLCAHDPLTSKDHRDVVVDAPVDSVLIVDSVFAMRPEYIEFWDFTIWLDVNANVSLERGVRRDAAMEGSDFAERLHRDRYRVAEEIYVTEVDPRSLVDVVIDNTHFSHPRIIPLE